MIGVLFEGAYHNDLIPKSPGKDIDWLSFPHSGVCSQWIGLFCVWYLPLYPKAEDLGGSNFPQERGCVRHIILAPPYPCLISFASKEFFWAVWTKWVLHFLFQSCSASALQARLKVAAHEAEEESDNIAEDFLEGKTEIDDFLSSFMEKRTVCNTLQLRTSDSVIWNYLSIFMSKKYFSTLVSWSFDCHEKKLKSLCSLRMIALSYYPFVLKLVNQPKSGLNSYRNVQLLMFNKLFKKGIIYK